MLEAKTHNIQLANTLNPTLEIMNAKSALRNFPYRKTFNAMKGVCTGGRDIYAQIVTGRSLGRIIATAILEERTCHMSE